MNRHAGSGPNHVKSPTRGVRLDTRAPSGGLLETGQEYTLRRRLGGVTVRGWLRSMAAPPIGMRPS